MFGISNDIYDSYFGDLLFSKFPVSTKFYPNIVIRATLGRGDGCIPSKTLPEKASGKNLELFILGFCVEL